MCCSRSRIKRSVSLSFVLALLFVASASADFFSGDFGDVGPGELVGWFTFRIDSNVELLNLEVAATHLYRGDDQASPFQIPLDAAGAFVVPGIGHEVIPDSDNFLWWSAPYTEPSGLTGWSSETGIFDSNQDNHFSQDVDVGITWNVPSNLPPGEYSGFVTLFVSIPGYGGDSATAPVYANVVPLPGALLLGLVGFAVGGLGLRHRGLHLLRKTEVTEIQ